MRRTFACFTLCLVALCACRKKETVQTAPLTPEQQAAIETEYVLPTNRPSPAPRSPASKSREAPRQPVVLVEQQPLQERIHGAIHAGLTLQLRRFVQKTGRVPTTFSEFANSAMDSAPLAPDGMKFVIDPADQTVKAVKK